MHISNINKFYNSGLKVLNNNFYSSNLKINAPLLSPLPFDTVSFKAKNYDSSSIKKPTGHCAYCGSKVYTQKQIDSLAEEFLKLKNSDLEGKIRSVLEKLGGPSDNALIRKKGEINKEYIEFFEKFRDFSSSNSSMTGLNILQKYFQLSREDSLSTLKLNLSPLLKTIDHVVPQHLDVENDNTDLNLVESCFTCNSKIKNGDSFESFYYMYPSIKDTMPKEKFEFASLDLLEKSPHLIALKMTSEELLKVLDNLFSEENNLKSSLFAIQEKIKNCVQSMETTVEKIRSEREIKKQEVQNLEKEYQVCLQDDEFRILLERKNISELIYNIRSELDDLHSQLSRISKNIEQTRQQLKDFSSSKSNSNKKKKHSSDSIAYASKDELNAKLTQLNESHIALNQVITEKKALLQNKLNELSSLNSKNPEIDVLREQKNRLDYLVSVHSQIKSLQKKSVEIENSISDTQAKLSDINESIRSLSSSLISISDVSETQRIEYQRYSELSAALKELEENEQLKDKKMSLIYSIAKPQILAEISQMQNNPFVKNHLIQESIDSLKNSESELKFLLRQILSNKDSNRAQLARLISELDKYSLEEMKVEENQSGENCVKLKSFSLRDLSSRIDSLTSKLSQYTTEYNNLPQLREFTPVESSARIDEYYSKLKEIDYLQSIVSSSNTPKDQKDVYRKKIAALKIEVEALAVSDDYLYYVENKRRYRFLNEHLLELRKGLESAQAPKERDSISRQISSISSEINDLANSDDEIFNDLITSKKLDLESKISSTEKSIADLSAQKEQILATLDKSEDVSNGFSISEAQQKSDELSIIIKRLNEKINWLEIPDRIKKIQTEIKIQSDNIDSLISRINSVKSS